MDNWTAEHEQASEIDLALLDACLFDVALVDGDVRPELEAFDRLLQPLDLLLL